MRIENNIHYSNRIHNNNLLNQSRQNNNPSFEGLNLKALNNINPQKILFPVNKDKLWSDCDYLGAKIGVHTRTLAHMLEYAPKKRVSLMRRLVENYNAKNFSFEKGLKEDPKPLLHIYETIEKPQSAHFNIIEKSQMPFKILDKIFQAATTKEDLNFVQIMQHDVLDYSKETGKIIVKMLESSHKEEYVKNLESYKSYLKLNAQKETCVEDLNKLLDSGNYDSNIFDKKLKFEKLMNQRIIRDNVGNYKSYIEENVNKNNYKFLKCFCNDFLAFRKPLTKDDQMDIIKMFSSTTPQNLNIRMTLINQFKHNYSQAETGVSDIRALKNLYKHIDSNPYKANFVKKALNNNIKIESIEELNTILTIVPPKQADIFYKNILRIVKYTTPEERKFALTTEVENPFFPIKRVNEKLKRNVVDLSNLPNDSKFEKFTKYLENRYNIMKYNKLKNTVDEYEPEYKEVDDIFKISDDFLSIPKVSDVISEPIITAAKPKLNLVRKLKTSSPSAKKLQLKSDVNNVIQKKLGQKTYENQSRDYSIKATAMRLKLLPEIFNSISATRKLQRAEGKRPNIENKDALLLYEKIKGRNRKLVNYMLKQTDENNNRIFNIKEIADLIDKTEIKISQDKMNISGYKAADAKAQYEEIFQNMIAEHGKLKRAKKKA